MATINATKDGLWSDATVWDSNPVMPAPGDTVKCGAWTVTIDQDVTVATLEADAAGFFDSQAGKTITANILSSAGHSSTCVVRNNTVGTVNIVGNVTGTTTRAVLNSNTGTLNVTGNVLGGGSNEAIRNSTTGTVNVTGNVTAGAGGDGIRNHAGTGYVNITGNVTGGSAATSYGVLNAETGIVTITGNVTGGSNATAYGVYNTATGTITITGKLINATAEAAYAASTGLITYAAALEMYDFLSTVTPDYSLPFWITPSEVIPERSSGQDKILQMYDATEERLSFSDIPEMYMRLRWDFLSETQAGVIWDYFNDYTKGARTTRTFPFIHPTDGHRYVVRFDDSMERVIRLANIHNITEILFRVVGKVVDP